MKPRHFGLTNVRLQAQSFGFQVLAISCDFWGSGPLYLEVTGKAQQKQVYSK